MQQTYVLMHRTFVVAQTALYLDTSPAKYAASALQPVAAASRVAPRAANIRDFALVRCSRIASFR